MVEWAIFLAAPVIGLSVYHLLPAVACRLGRQLAAARWNTSSGSKAQGMNAAGVAWLPGAWQQKMARRLQLAGFLAANSLNVYLALQTMLVPVLLILGRLAGIRGSQPVWLGIVLITLINGGISRRIALRKRAFSCALFKIYRFLDLQLAAGIRMTDTLRGLPEAVADQLVQPVLIRFTALYELTLDLDLAFGEIRQAFGCPDCEILATHLRQCLQTGEAGNTLARMEELLFSRYFNLMQADTRKIRTKLLIAAILGIFPGTILFLYPLLFEATQAMQSVFG